MKKLIRWISDISGVTDEIEKETAITIGYNMYDYSYWFTQDLEACNVLALYSTELKKGVPHLYGNQFENIRSKVRQMSKDKKMIHK